MGIVELFFVAVGLSMDAFAVAICKGLGMRRVHYGQALIIALAFGGFQALMPLLGWLLGSSFKPLIDPVDHWIAFGLLAFIGAKMIWDALHEEDPTAEIDEAAEDPRLKLGEVLLLAIATSIDALAAGISFALLDVNIVVAITVIGVTTFCFSFAGVAIGNHFGARFERAATIVGGIVLIIIGLHILLEGLGVLG